MAAAENQQPMEIAEENVPPEVLTVRGPGSSFVKLVSADGHEFFIRRRFIKASETIKNMLECGPSAYSDDEPNEVRLSDIESVSLNRACEYLCYYDRYTDCWYQIPEFPIEEKICIDLLLAANFMKC